VGDVSDKAVGVQDIPAEAVGQLAGALLDPAADAAHQVDVVGVVGQVVGGCAVVEVGVAHHAERLERLEGAVDGGRRKSGPPVIRHPLDDRVGSGVAQRRHRVEHALALRGHASPLGAQLVADILHALHCTVRFRTVGACRARTATYTVPVLDQFEQTHEASSHPTPRRGRRVRRAIAVLLAVVVLVVVGGTAAYLLFLNHTVTTNVKHESLLPTPGVSGATGAPGRSAKAGNAQNYLVLGSDARPGESRGRSDVIVLVHVASDHRTVTLVHFPRDLYVSVPGHGKDKINAAYAYGGAPLLVQTLQDLVGVPIDHVAVIGFEGFKRMTDAVGGVNVYVEEPSSSDGFTFHKGFQQMGGAEALAFVRERKDLSEGDISRGRRQQAFIKALMLKSLSRDVLANPVRLAHFTDAATSNLTVDDRFSVGEMRSQAISMRSLRSRDVTCVTAPFTGYGTAPNGGSIDLVDQAGMQALGEALQNDAMAGYTDTTRTP
jgi:LCP family protein required for cell wall assembly